jgi:hypothetical protein
MRGNFIAAGCTLTFLCWVAAALFALGPIMGDCMAVPGRECPTDHQRDMELLKIVLSAAFVNIFGLFVIGYRHLGRKQS